MFYLRQKQLLEDSRINLPYVPNNSRNLNQPKDFEYDITASALYLYKIIDGCEVQFFIMWMPADKLRHFHVRASRWNHNKGVYDKIISQHFDKNGKPLCGAYCSYDGSPETFNREYVNIIRKGIQFYLDSFPQFNYL